MSNSDKSDVSIIKFFKGSYQGEVTPGVIENFSSTAQLHIDKILEIKPESVLDVGMGAGGLLLDLQNSGQLASKNIYGVELSPDAIELAKKRFEKYGNIEAVKFFEGNFLDYEAPDVDAISIHRVFCCHPNYKGILSKAVESKPKIILYTLPRGRIFIRIGVAFLTLFKKILKGFRTYAHSPKKIETILMIEKYEKIYSKKGFIWETSAFQLIK